MGGRWTRALRETGGALRCSYRQIRRPGVIKYNGILIPIDHDLYSRHIFATLCQGEYEFEETYVARSVLNKHDTVLELGGGIGYIAALCCTILGDDTRVHSFEANPYLLAVAQKTFELNNIRPRLSASAVGRTAGTIRFYLHEDFWLSSTRPMHDRQCEQIMVECRALPDLLREIRPSVLICDIEGGEDELFDGVDLSCLRALVVEVHPSVVGRTRVQWMIQMLLNAGFLLDTVHSHNNVLCFDR